MTDNNNKSTLKEAFDAELMKRLEENPPEIPTYEEFSAMVDKSLAERCRRRKRIAGIAAGFVVVLLAGILACTNLTADVDADKNPKEEIITEDGVIIEDGGWGSSDGEDNVWVIDKWEDVYGVRKVYNEFLIPEYIPKGYEFEKLSIEQIETGDVTSEYIFKADNFQLEIETRMKTTNRGSLEIEDIVRSVECAKGIIYIKETKNKIATIQLNDGIIVNIWCTLADDEIVSIVEGLHY